MSDRLAAGCRVFPLSVIPIIWKVQFGRAKQRNKEHHKIPCVWWAHISRRPHQVMALKKNRTTGFAGFCMDDSHGLSCAWEWVMVALRNSLLPTWHLSPWLVLHIVSWIKESENTGKVCHHCEAGTLNQLTWNFQQVCHWFSLLSKPLKLRRVTKTSRHCTADTAAAWRGWSPPADFNERTWCQVWEMILTSTLLSEPRFWFWRVCLLFLYVLLL